MLSFFCGDMFFKVDEQNIDEYHFKIVNGFTNFSKEEFKLINA